LFLLALAGIGYVGLQWQTWSSPAEGNCWSRLAKWPDGQPFSIFDVFEQDNTRDNMALNKANDAWAAESILTRNQWVALTRQKLVACETGGAIFSLVGQPNSAWGSLRNSLIGLLLPPLMILMMVWVARGFQSRLREP
jgi:hypothetical protein